MSDTLKSKLLSEAKALGFVACRITTPNAVPNAAARLDAFLQAGYHGSMDWLAERAHWRRDPTALWSDAQSVIMLADSYTPHDDPLAILKRKNRAAISVYARNKDYHDIVKKRLKRLGRWLLEQKHGEIKVFVDTAPVMEKPLGAAAGLGWQGKHTNLLSRDLGNWFFLGAIFTTLVLPADQAEQDHCGGCRACLDICPTEAFVAPYQLDARRCISYLTIEHKEPIDLELRSKLGNRIYGCDDCLAICPWNKFAKQAKQIGYSARDDLKAPRLAQLARLDDAQFRAYFSKSPIKRIGRNRFLRNVAYAIGNSGDTSLLPVAQDLAHEPDAVLAEAAQWAAKQLKDKA